MNSFPCSCSCSAEDFYCAYFLKIKFHLRVRVSVENSFSTIKEYKHKTCVLCILKLMYDFILFCTFWSIFLRRSTHIAKYSEDPVYMLLNLHLCCCCCLFLCIPDHDGSCLHLIVDYVYHLNNSSIFPSRRVHPFDTPNIRVKTMYLINANAVSALLRIVVGAAVLGVFPLKTIHTIYPYVQFILKSQRLSKTQHHTLQYCFCCCAWRWKTFSTILRSILSWIFVSNMYFLFHKQPCWRQRFWKVPVSSRIIQFDVLYQKMTSSI